MTMPRRCALRLAVAVAMLPAAALAQEPTYGGWPGEWVGIYTCAPSFRYEYYGASYYMHWNCGSSDVVYVAYSTTGVTTGDLLDAATRAATEWTSHVPALPDLTFTLGTNVTYSRVAFLTDAEWTARGLRPTAPAAAAVATNDNGTVRHGVIYLHVKSDSWGWCTDCTAVGVDCYESKWYDLRTVLAHEFGHWWVLGDTDDLTCGEDQDLMYWGIYPGYVIRTPSYEDILSASVLYDMAVEATASLYRVEATPDGVDLVWLLGRGGQSACVERCLPAGSWSVLETVVADGTGWLHFHDATVVPGTRYGYRLRLDGADGDLLAGETWVDVPLWVLTLGPITPNPSRDGAPRVRCVLPDATPASLDVVDVSGRLVGRTDVGALGRGVHTVQLGAGSPLAGGVYWLRLRQGTQALTTRAVIAR